MESVERLPQGKAPRSERLLIAARDARFYIDMTPRILPEDDDPPELLELEALLEARRRTSDLPADPKPMLLPLKAEGERGRRPRCPWPSATSASTWCTRRSRRSGCPRRGTTGRRRPGA